MDAADFDQKLSAVLGDRYYLRDPGGMAPYLEDWRGRYRGAARGVAFPADAAQVSDVVRLCAEAGIAVVPQGGNTGLTGGAVPQDEAAAVVINLSRLNAIQDIDLDNNSVTVGAGCILETLREAVAANGRLFPMDLGSSGSCEVGGLISTNAGGTEVLRYGNMRDLVLGLQVVLPDGRIWNGLRGLRKDNTGYDLKQLFIGAEGTLGIVTAAVLKLFPALGDSVTAMVAFDSAQDAIRLLQDFRARIGNRIESFEIMSQSQIAIALDHGDGRPCPLPADLPWYVILELADTSAGSGLETLAEEVLAEAFEAGRVLDATIAADLSKAERIWNLRHTISESNKRHGFTVSNDTSVPISAIPEFIARVEARVAEELPGATLCHVGHIGDGNVHEIVIFPFSVFGPDAKDESRAAQANAIVHSETLRLGGSISAEHGIGLMHVNRLAASKDPLDLDLMARIKRAFDPSGIMNPGKVLKS
ncbi:FAD-binding oxidoreductase [uncultured Paracoccus sp.]|uniref:FAD-binding oxidoreductase n=1 Tax=uncultured Paracoccus sp. TaxID=189685 RepID=UPI0025F51A8B|nr:FAD-binding oxidoreductase [uncultured Paracoccus sp.]